MTLEELAAGSGLDVAAVEQLESYGLLCGRVVGGVVVLRRGRPHRGPGGGRASPATASRRGTSGCTSTPPSARPGFIEQIVLPLLKQRNPEARQRAHEIVTELTRLGQALREVLLRTTLRDQLGG